MVIHQELETLKLVDPTKCTKPQLFTIQWTKKQAAKKKKPAPKKMKQLAKKNPAQKKSKQPATKNPGTKKEQKLI